MSDSATLMDEPDPKASVARLVGATAPGHHRFFSKAVATDPAALEKML